MEMLHLGQVHRALPFARRATRPSVERKASFRCLNEIKTLTYGIEGKFVYSLRFWGEMKQDWKAIYPLEKR